MAGRATEGTSHHTGSRVSVLASSTNLTRGEPAGKLDVRTPAPREVWRQLLRTDLDAVPSQMPEWLDCLCTFGGYEDASRLYETADGRKMILPLVRRSYLPGGPSVLESLPAGWGYGGLVAPGGISPSIVAAVLDDLSQHLALRVHIRPNPLHAAVWEAGTAGRSGITAVRRYAHVLDLDGGFDRVWRDRFKGNARQQVRRAERMGVVVETDTSGRLVPVFYDLLQQSFDRWAQQQHEPRVLARYRGRRRDPLHKFRTITSRLAGTCQISVAWYEGRPAASILVLQAANAHYTRGAMDKPLAGRSYANSLLYKHAIDDACRSGCRVYHMGESGQSSGIARFKGKFGAEPYPYAEYWLERLPMLRLEQAVRDGVKRLIGFRDV